MEYYIDNYSNMYHIQDSNAHIGFLCIIFIDLLIISGLFCDCFNKDTNEEHID